MPIFPIVRTVANAQLGCEALLTHHLVKVDITVEEEIIITAIKEPFHAAERIEFGFVGLLDNRNRVVIMNSI